MGGDVIARELDNRREWVSEGNWLIETRGDEKGEEAILANKIGLRPWSSSSVAYKKLIVDWVTL